MRIELRKVETLPGGGITNTFFDFVGQSPISVWQSNEEYGELTSVRHIHFSWLDTFSLNCLHMHSSIRIAYHRWTFLSSFVFQSRFHPALRWRRAVRIGFISIIDSNSRIDANKFLAGVKYELIATICVKGKK